MRIQPKHCALWWPIVSDVCYLRISNWMVPVVVVLEKFAASKSWWEIVSIIKLIKNHSLCIESSVYKNLGMRKVVCIIWDFGGVVCIIAVISMITSPWFRTLVNFVSYNLVVSRVWWPATATCNNSEAWYCSSSRNENIKAAEFRG